jgi:branched-chain amino acid transport system permease protein
MNRWILIALAVLVVIGLALLPMWIPPFYVRVLQFFFFSAGLAIAWNILGGFSGYWSFGHTAFIGVGGFAAAHFVMRVGTFGPPPISALFPILIGGLVAAGIAAVIAYPILRLRGIYFAIAMLGVGQVFAELANNIRWFQGGIGLFLPAAVPQGMPPERYYYYIFGGLLLFAFAVSVAVKYSRLGAGLLAIREDEDTAGMLGVPAERFKVAAYVISAGLVGMLGAAYAHSVGYFTTDTVFRIDFSLNMIVYCLIGGLGTLFGPVIGAAIMLFVTQVLLSHLLEYHLLITGLIVVVIVLVIPNGILGTIANEMRRRRQAAKPRLNPDPVAEEPR